MSTHLRLNAIVNGYQVWAELNLGQDPLSWIPEMVYIQID